MNSRSNTLTPPSTPLIIELYTGSKSSKGRGLQVVVSNDGTTPQIFYNNSTKGIGDMPLTTTGIGDMDLTATNSYNIPDLQVVPPNSNIAKNVPDKVKVTDMCR